MCGKSRGSTEKEGVVGVAITQEGLREEEPRRIWEDEEEFSAGEGCSDGGLGHKMEE